MTLSKGPCNCISLIYWALIVSTLLSHWVLGEQACQAWINWGIIIRNLQLSCQCNWRLWILELATVCSLCTWGKDVERLLLLITSETEDALGIFVSYTSPSSCLWNFIRAAKLYSCTLKFTCVWTAKKNCASLDSFHTEKMSSLDLITSSLVKITQKPRNRGERHTSSQRNKDWD